MIKNKKFVLLLLPLVFMGLKAEETVLQTHHFNFDGQKETKFSLSGVNPSDFNNLSVMNQSIEKGTGVKPGRIEAQVLVSFPNFNGEKDLLNLPSLSKRDLKDLTAQMEFSLLSNGNVLLKVLGTNTDDLFVLAKRKVEKISDTSELRSAKYHFKVYFSDDKILGPMKNPPTLLNLKNRRIKFAVDTVHYPKLFGVFLKVVKKSDDKVLFEGELQLDEIFVSKSSKRTIRIVNSKIGIREQLVSGDYQVTVETYLRVDGKVLYPNKAKLSQKITEEHDI